MDKTSVNHGGIDSATPTLFDLLLAHQNDYGFNPVNILSTTVPSVPNLSIIIPYYETGSLIQNTLRHLYDSISLVVAAYPEWHYEVILLDDGSQHRPALPILNIIDWKNLMILCAHKNQGRTRTRNEGLINARYEKCLFMDSDILVDTTSLLNNLKLHAVNLIRNRKDSVTIALFENQLGSMILQRDKPLHSEDLNINDFRSQCVYQQSWIGCEADKQFISHQFHLIENTNFFRKWAGLHGPWCLANMVLGGFFMVNRNSSLAVNGFDIMFAGYGFTETSLATKLFAVCGQYLIPQMVGGAVHCEGNPAHNDVFLRDKYFQEKHRLYFEHYLHLSAKESINRPLHGWKL